jgi:hypothetical protein
MGFFGQDRTFNIFRLMQVLETLKGGKSANEAVALAVSILEVCYP